MSLQRVAFQPLHTFTRATDEAFWNRVVDAFGNVSYELQTAPAGTAVQNAYDPSTGEPLGLQIFEQRTNLLTYSEQFDNASWTKTRSSITANAIVAPDGLTTADKFIANTESSTHAINKTGGTVGVAETYSVFAKAGEYDWIAVSHGNRLCYFDLANGALGTVAAGATAKIEDAGNGWYRCSVSSTRDAVNNFLYIGEANNDVSFAGNDSDGLYVWGAQLEAGAFPTPYIPTVATTATRNADVITVPDIDTSDWWNPSEGTFVVEYKFEAIGKSAGILTLTTASPSTGNRFEYYHSIGAGSGANALFGGGSIVTVGAYKQGKNKAAFTLTATGAKVSVNGAAAVSLTNLGTSSVADFGLAIIGGNVLSQTQPNNTINQILYIPTAVSDAKLQELSAL